MPLLLRGPCWNAVRIGADDGLTRIGTLMDCGLAVVFTDAQACVGARRDRAPGCYDPLVRFGRLLNAQCLPEAGTHPQLRLDFMLFCGRDRNLRPCPMRRPVAVSQPAMIFWPPAPAAI